MATILVCDDSILARKQLKDAIKAVNPDITFIEGKNGQEAVEAFDKNDIDLAFLDIVMPIKDGTTAVAEICKNHEDAQIVIVSSVGTQEQLKKAIEAGAKDFLQKPFEIDKVKDIVSKRLGGN